MLYLLALWLSDPVYRVSILWEATLLSAPVAYSSASKRKSSLLKFCPLMRATLARLSLASANYPFETSHFGDSGTAMIARHMNMVRPSRLASCM